MILLTFAYSLEESTFFGAIWLYAVKYYEAATDIERMLRPRSELEKDDETKKNKKRKFLALRWIVFCLICVPLLVIDIT